MLTYLLSCTVSTLWSNFRIPDPRVETLYGIVSFGFYFKSAASGSDPPSFLPPFPLDLVSFRATAGSGWRHLLTWLLTSLPADERPSFSGGGERGREREFICQINKQIKQIQISTVAVYQ